MKGKHGELLRDEQTHTMLVRQTGVHKITKEQQDVMDKIMGETAEFTLEDENSDPECTMDLPILIHRG